MGLHLVLEHPRFGVGLFGWDGNSKETMVLKNTTTTKRLKFEVTKKTTPFFGCFFGGSGVGFLKKIKQIMGGVFFGIFVSDEWKDQSKRSFVCCSKRKFRKTANWWKDLLPFFLQDFFGFKGKRLS